MGPSATVLVEEQHDSDIEVVSKRHRCIRRNKCLSCLCFVFGCVNSSAVKSHKGLNRKPSPVYFDEEINGMDVSNP